NSDFDQNSALSGGAIAGGEGVHVKVTHSVFTRGNASGPGAIDADFVSIDESEFVDNFGGSSGAIRVRVDGLVSTTSFRDNFGVQVGAVDIREDIDIVDCEFISNVGNFGGAVRSQGRGTIARSRFELNQAEDGGAIFGPAVVSASVLSFNRAARFGGAAFGLDTFAESTADNNTAEVAGGGLYDTQLITDAVVRENLAPEAPGVWVGERGSDIRRSQLASASDQTVRVEANAAPATIADSLIVGGVRARSGAFVELIRSTSVRGANSTGNILDVDATSALVAESTVIDGGGIELMTGATVLLIQSHLSAGLDAVTGDATGLEVFGELSQDAPGFVSPAGTDDNPATWPDNDYRLRPRSPLIDRGFALGIAQDATDIRGFFRVRNDDGVPDRQIGPAPVDIGAFEFQGTSCLADMNDDGRLSPGDFNAWILAYNLDDRFADQNQDGVLTPGDFNAWTINFNAGCD
ncbi:MAG: choice-of-anchor Q domain-containing protein, partial [Planctomycetota bacterium]